MSQSGDDTSTDALIDTVLVDIDGTICEYEGATTNLLPVAFKRAGVESLFSLQEYVDRNEEFIEDSGDVDHHRELCSVDIAREK